MRRMDACFGLLLHRRPYDGQFHLDSVSDCEYKIMD
jgi:hypothetical protein